MKKLIFFVLLSLLVQGCNNHKHKITEDHPFAMASDTLQPQVRIKVNKKYDDKGNLLQFDSTYSYFYSLPGQKAEALSSDSLYTQLESKLRSRYTDWLEPPFDPIFFTDSLYKYDFLNSDYFDQRFELNEPSFYVLLRKMDSLKTDMLNHYFSDGTMKRKK
jgi:hypothetical protein